MQNVPSIFMKETFMADRTRLELATSGLTGRRSNQLNYRSAYMVGITGFEPVTPCL